MKKWKEWIELQEWKKSPLLLIRRLVLLLLTGAGCILVGTVGFLSLGDRILLSLSIAVSMGSFIKGMKLWQLIRKHEYEIVAGVCVGITAKPFKKYKRIKMIEESGLESSLLIPKQAQLKIGYRYHFFFQKKPGEVPGSEGLTTLLASALFLGYEALGAYWETDTVVHTVSFDE